MDLYKNEPSESADPHEPAAYGSFFCLQRKDMKKNIA